MSPGEASRWLWRRVRDPGRPSRTTRLTRAARADTATLAAGPLDVGLNLAGAASASSAAVADPAASSGARSWHELRKGRPWAGLGACVAVLAVVWTQ